MQHVLRKIADQPRISQYLMARYAEEVAEDPSLPMGELIRTLYAEISRRYLEDDDLEKICLRIYNHGKALQERHDKQDQQQGQRRAPAKPERGQYMATHMSKMDTTATCLWLANFDAREATRLYMEEDYELVEAMAEAKRTHEQEVARLDFENALYGFGGSYGKSSAPGGRDEGEVRVHDMRGLTSEEALARIQSLGRRTH